MNAFHRRTVLSLWLAMTTLSLATSAALADDSTVSPEELIRNMSTAITGLNYEGRFVHVRNGNVEAMSIVHSKGTVGELEYMLSLNGEAREVYRNSSLVTCIWPSSKSVIVSDSKERKLIPVIDESLVDSGNYKLSMSKPDRVAGIHTHVIDVKPIDRFRYGYRFWIDKETSMLLRSMLIDNDGAAIEQMMFTNIAYPKSIAAERFETPGEKIASYKKQLPKPAVANTNVDRVNFSDLPEGYREISETYQPMPINDGPVSHVMLSDGMASVSVYVEYVSKADQAEMTLGMFSMGGMNAYTHSMPNALVTAVGEVPPATVEAIAVSVQISE